MKPDAIRSLLVAHGPLVSSVLARLLVDEHGLTPTAARKRLSRTPAGVRRLAYIKFPRNARFVYLQSDYGSPEFWSALTSALVDTNSAYGGGLTALEQRGGLMPKAHYSIACGSPLKQKGHLSSVSVLESLKKAKLLAEIDVPGIGTCVGFAQQDPSFYQPKIVDLKARLVVEAILLKGIRMWIRNLGLGSYGKVRVRDEADSPPQVGTFLWDLSAPSYLAPLVEWVNGKPKAGFVACDVLLGSPITENGIRPFLRKCEALRALPRVGRCLQIFVAERYDAASMRAAKERGIVAATPESLFGAEVAAGLAQLTELLKDAASLAANPTVFNVLFEQLGRIEGATVNLRGALFEFLVAELVRQQYGGLVQLNRTFRKDDGEKAEVDVIAEHAMRTVHFLECKGYQPAGTVPDEEVERWLTKRIPLVRDQVLRHPEWRDRRLNFEFWTTGKLSDVSIAKIEAAKRSVRPTKYTLDYRDSQRVLEFAREVNDRALIDALQKHFLEHPLATLERDAERRERRARPRRLPAEWDDLDLEVE